MTYLILPHRANFRIAANGNECWNNEGFDVRCNETGEVVFYSKLRRDVIAHCKAAGLSYRVK